jgi:hypothetical protein
VNSAWKKRVSGRFRRVAESPLRVAHLAETRASRYRGSGSDGKRGKIMGGFSLVHLIIVLLVLFVFLFPMATILRKAGYSGWWVLLWFVPLGNLVGLWIFAFADWPALKNPGQMRA